MHGGRRLRRVLTLVGVFAVGVTLLTGAVAAVDASDRNAVTALDGPIGTEPLDGANGTTEVIVRFTPNGEPDADDHAVADELRDHAAAEQVAFEAFAAEHDAITIESEFWLVNAMLVVVDADAVAADELLAVANVTDIHANVEIGTLGSKTDERRGAFGEERTGDTTSQTGTPPGEHTSGLELIGAPDAWNRFDTRGAGATVAVIDTGVDPDHQDIDLDGWAQYDENGTLVSDDLADAADPNGHGTHVAGTVAGGNASGTHIGVAPDASVYGIDTFDADGMATFASVLAGMEHATAAEEVDVLQMSLGANGTFGGFIRPVRNARAADKVVVAASGNTGPGTSSSPANTYDSLAVGAVRTDRTVATFSSGESINKTAAFADPPAEWPDRYVVPDVTAPGVNVLSADAGTVDGYVEQQGTSMAAPHVSGIAALAVAATDGRIEGDDLQSVIVDTAVRPDGDVEPDDRYGHGVVDATAAVESSIETAPQPTPTPTPTPTATPPSTPEAVDPATSDRTPGFGVGVGVVAVIVTAMATAVVGRHE
ncbi:S8 family serine peptidase [Halorubrum sp. DTA98]|uniref:S8 family serine peptidase n=1 Tax=Halorubrum sp. DTA98 TaxID=3402163 RepID=UPI003AADDAE4